MKKLSGLPLTLVYIFIVLTGLSSYSFISNSPVSASTNNLLITEVYPSPLTGEREWIELYNESNLEINLEGWYIMDKLTQPTIIEKFQNQILKPFEIFIVSLNTQKLNNSGDGVSIFNDQDVLIDSISYQSSTSGLSWHRVSTLSGELYLDSPTPMSWEPLSQELLSPSPTSPISPSVTKSLEPFLSPTKASVSQPSITPTPIITHKSIDITEVMSCPESPETEWVEIYNHENYEILLTNWIIEDNQNNKISLNAEIPSKSYFIFEWSKAILNNAGDHLSIKNSSGEIIIDLEIPSCKVGHSYSSINGEYLWIYPPSKGVANVTQASTITPTNSLIPSVSIKTSEATNQNNKQDDSDYTINTSHESQTSQQTLLPIQPFQHYNFNNSATISSQNISSSSTPRASSEPEENNAFPSWPYLNVIIGGALLSTSGIAVYAKRSIDQDNN